jgi:ketosteroid isomerase-like protein
MQTDPPDTVREIRAAFDAYEAALMANDVAALTGFFWRDPRAARTGGDGPLYGWDAIAGFRRGRDASDVSRELGRVEVHAFGPDHGIATAEYRRLGSGRTGAQSQTWVRFPEGWRIVAAHVSLGPAKEDQAG